MRHRTLAVITGALLPIVLAFGLVASSSLQVGEGVLGERVFELQRVHEARFPPAPGEPVFVLAMGHDARPGEAGSRADALHLVGINPGAGKATILNIPRDTWVRLPGGGTDKINSAHLRGGPVLEAETVGQLVGVDVPFVLSTGFEGFTAMVDEMGGVDVDVPVPMADANSGAYFDAGPNHLDGAAALAFARNRGISGGDLRRTEHQGLLLVAALAKLRGQQPDPVKTLRWLAVFLRHGRVDGAGVMDLYHLGRLALSIDAANVRSVTMPSSLGRAANQSVVFVGGEADALFADFRDDAVLQSH